MLSKCFTFLRVIGKPYSTPVIPSLYKEHVTETTVQNYKSGLYRRTNTKNQIYNCLFSKAVTFAVYKSKY